MRRLLEEVEATPAANNAHTEVFRQLRERNRKLEATVTDVSLHNTSIRFSISDQAKFNEICLNLKTNVYHGDCIPNSFTKFK